MGSLFAFFILFSLVLFGSTIDARPDSGEYWKGVMKDQPMPEALHGLLPRGSVSPLLTTAKTDCHTSTEATNNNQTAKTYVKDFEPRPSVTGYHDDSTKLTGEKSFANDFEPRPSVTGYHDDSTKLTGEKSFANDFEPRPSVTGYHDDSTKLTGEKSFANDFEPRPNVSAYPDDAGLKEKKSFVKDFEPRPNVSFYDD
ncbi:organ-specific protein P4-like isoform X1 [Rhododendron vialii]|uniref:organ-specific protein P4-like isoform X1 n=2 Tax=Rhododendron vialii TaxID=182163 RepID=UPI00265F4359|nr:organ-specific protein P4-like isoform X1 [Rhododendron vialii]